MSGRIPAGVFFFRNSHGDLRTATDIEGKPCILRLCIIDDVTDLDWFGVAFQIIDDGKEHPFKQPHVLPHVNIHTRMTKETPHVTH